MKRNSKSQISTFLMLVGAFFIIIAGSIFVTTTWKYLPDFVKQILLFTITIGLFIGRKKVSENEKLRKTEIVLFYLGAIFLGLSSLFIMVGIDSNIVYNIHFPKAWSIAVAHFVMLFPIVFRFIKMQTGGDFCGMTVTLDGLLIWTSVFALDVNSGKSSVQVFMLGLGVILILFSIGDYYKEQWIGRYQSGLKSMFQGFFITHAVLYVFFGVLSAVLVDKGVKFLLVLIAVICTYILYKENENSAYRVFNSIAILLSIAAGVDFINSILPETTKLTFSESLFISYLINLLIMVISLRKEFTYIMVIYGFAAPFFQLLCYGGYEIFSDAVPHTVSTYYPYSLVLAAAVLALMIRWLSNGSVTWEQKGKKIAAAAALQMVSTFVTYFAATRADAFYMAFYTLITVVLVTLALFAKKKSVRSLLLMGALLTGESAAFSQPLLLVPEQYIGEWNCFLLAIGIVLLHCIWYDKSEAIRVVNFIFTCCLLVYLLLKDMLCGELGNVLILGITGALMLLIAAIFNRREYVIAASVTLLILVFYITRSFWLSIAWWVYLFIAGVVLILLAVKKEREA